MTDSFYNPQNLSESSRPTPEMDKKRRLWRNIFLLNLCISLLLVGFFWLPIKIAQLEEFANSPSVNLPQKGETAKKEAPKVVPTHFGNMLATQYAMVNASSEKDWIYFDFSRGSEVKIHDSSSLEWDLAFRRSKVITNGGATNKFGKAGMLDMGVVDFNTVSEVPDDNYVVDVSTRTETKNPVLLKWYKYNYLSHKLSAKKNIYAIRTSDNKFAKIQFISFYCDNKETGCIRMQYVYQDNGSNSFLKNRGSFAFPVASNPESNKS